MNVIVEDTTTVYNGINAVTGDYLDSPSVAELSKELRGEPEAEVPAHLKARDAGAVAAMALPFDVDDLLLDQAGWGIVFAHGASQDILDALKPLRDLRERQAGARYQEFTGARAYRPGEKVAPPKSAQ